jgi:hypothetical protein
MEANEGKCKVLEQNMPKVLLLVRDHCCGKVIITNTGVGAFGLFLYPVTLRRDVSCWRLQSHSLQSTSAKFSEVPALDICKLTVASLLQYLAKKKRGAIRSWP